MRLALPKGRLLEPALRLLARAGYTFRSVGERSYHLAGPAEIDARLFKPRSIPDLLQIGAVDVGLTGLDVVRDSCADGIVCLLDLGLNRVDVKVAVPVSKRGLLENLPPRPLVVATEYPQLAEEWMMARGLAHVILRSQGTTEAYLPDIADVIVDCVETGATLEANGLVAVEDLFPSSTWVVVQKHVLARPSGVVQTFLDDVRTYLESVHEDA